MNMIIALRLSTIEVVNRDMKQESHLQGRSCRYRDMCCLMLQGLRRLKTFDDKFDISQCQLYSGLANATYGTKDKKSCISPLLNRLNGISIDDPNYVATNALEYCRLWHGFISTSKNVKIAQAFCFGDLQSVGFLIAQSNLQVTENILFGDISWISVAATEKEVLFGPCLLELIPAKDDKLDSTNSNANSKTQWFYVRPKPVQHVQSLLTPEYRNRLAYGGHNRHSNIVKSVVDIECKINTDKNENQDESKQSESISDASDAGGISVTQFIREIFIDENGNTNQAKINHILDIFDENEIEEIRDITFAKLKPLTIAGSMFSTKDVNVIINAIYAHYVANGHLNYDQQKIHTIVQNACQVKRSGKTANKLMKRYFVAFMHESDRCESSVLKSLTKENNLTDFINDLSIETAEKCKIKDELRKYYGTGSVNESLSCSR